MGFVASCSASPSTVAPGETVSAPDRTAEPSPPPETPVGQGQFPLLRVTNQSDFTLEDLVILFPQDRIEFGDVPAGATTVYQDVPGGIYRYAAYEVVIEGQKYEQPVIDWVGESPMPGNAFTYVLDADPAAWETDGLVIWLVEGVVDN
jgi:hypothetical protein